MIIPLNDDSCGYLKIYIVKEHNNNGIVNISLAFSRCAIVCFLILWSAMSFDCTRWHDSSLLRLSLLMALLEGFFCGHTSSNSFCLASILSDLSISQRIYEALCFCVLFLELKTFLLTVFSRRYSHMVGPDLTFVFMPLSSRGYLLTDSCFDSRKLHWSKTSSWSSSFFFAYLFFFTHWYYMFFFPFKNTTKF